MGTEALTTVFTLCVGLVLVAAAIVAILLLAWFAWFILTRIANTTGLAEDEREALKEVYKKRGASSSSYY